MLTVDVLLPEVEGETVTFRWTQSEHNPFQQHNQFFFRYEGIDLSRFSLELFIEIFLSQQLRVFAAYERPMTVNLPIAIPRSTVEFWRAFHDADQVEIGPTTDAMSYDPWCGPPQSGLSQHAYAVFFGGGKDSMMTTCMLAELYGPEQVLLIQYNGPTSPSFGWMDNMTANREYLMLEPARTHLGVATRRVWTDYQSWFRPSHYHARPHLEYYTAGALPTLLASGVRLATFCVALVHYSMLQADGRRWFYYNKSRPEMLKQQSRHYGRVLGTSLEVTNLNLPYRGGVAFKILADRYPDAFSRIVMCPSPTIERPWCASCSKCGNYALLGLAHGIVDPDFDYEQLFANSPWITRMMSYALVGEEHSILGNVPWISALWHETSYLPMCDALARLDIVLVAPRFGPRGLANLLTLQAMFGNTRFPQVAEIPRDAVDILDNETARQMLDIAGQHVPIVDSPGRPYYVGNEEADLEFRNIRMVPSTSAVPHMEDDDDG